MIGLGLFIKKHLLQVTWRPKLGATTRPCQMNRFIYNFRGVWYISILILFWSKLVLVSCAISGLISHCIVTDLVRTIFHINEYVSRSLIFKFCFLKSLPALFFNTLIFPILRIVCTIVSYSFVDHLWFLVSCVSHAFASVRCCFVVTCWDSAGLLALVGDVYLFLLLSHVVPRVRCGTWLYRFWSFPSFLLFPKRRKRYFHYCMDFINMATGKG